jgi:beta-galactosidase
LAGYDDPFFGKYPAITENKFGKGSFIYEGSLVSDEIQLKIVANKAKEIGLDDSNQITYPVVIRSGTNDQGKTIRYYLNYSGKEQPIVFNFDKGVDLLSGVILNRKTC